MADQEYELFAIRYATRDAQRSEHFIGGDPHDGPMPMDYFMWLAKGRGRSFVIDTGFNAEVAKRRKRTFLRCPVETLAAFDIDANEVEDVILTHLHYDHAGNFDRFPKRDSISRNASLRMLRAALCDIRGCRIHSRSRTSVELCG
jgi:glyoxylase-like metal-dependent hydrolase (beta-lactamase superfamily II)